MIRMTPDRKKRMTANEKAEKIIEKEQCFRISDKERYEFWTVKGLSNEIYNVVFHKADNTHSCNCKNIKHSDCCHIIAVKTLQEEGKDGLID